MVWLQNSGYILIFMLFSACLDLITDFKAIPCLRVAASVLLIWKILGGCFALDVLVITGSFSLVGVLIHKLKVFIWVFSIAVLLVVDKILEHRSVKGFILNTSYLTREQYLLAYPAYFMVVMRGISVALTVADEFSGKSTALSGSPSGNKLATSESPKIWVNFIDILEYAFYPYTIVFGPLVIYSDWKTYVQRKSGAVPVNSTRSLGFYRQLCCSHLLWRALRLFVWICLWNMALVFIYPNAILTYPVFARNELHSPHDNPWKAFGPNTDIMVWAAVYLAGMHFYSAHLVGYGLGGLMSDTENFIRSQVSSQKITEQQSTDREPWSKKRHTLAGKGAEIKIKAALANVDGNQFCLVPAPPSCSYRILLFSEIWRTFDRGLYNFLTHHIYYPLLAGKRRASNAGPDFRATVIQTSSLLFPFMIVLILHAPRPGNVIWTIINAGQILTERFIKWSYRKTRFGARLREVLSLCVLEHLCGVICAMSWILSMVGFVFFNFGYYVGVSFVRHTLLSRATLLILFERWVMYHFCSNYGPHPLPYGFSDQPDQKK
ncbi:unnamed protein product [Calicophoron daubneyi]